MCYSWLDFSIFSCSTSIASVSGSLYVGHTRYWSTSSYPGFENPAKKVSPRAPDADLLTSSVPDPTTAMESSTPINIDASRSSGRAQLNDIIQLGLKRMDEKKIWRIAGQEVNLGDQIAQAAGFVQWAKEWIDEAVQVSPQASLVWSGVSLVLPLLTNSKVADEANRDGFTYVTSRMRYYAALEPLLDGKTVKDNDAITSASESPEAARSHGSESVAESSVLELYTAILDFQIRSVLRFYRSRLANWARDAAHLQIERWDEMLKRIRILDDRVKSDLDTHTLRSLENMTSQNLAKMDDLLSISQVRLT
jgi:hypothetical protein